MDLKIDFSNNDHGDSPLFQKEFLKEKFKNFKNTIDNPNYGFFHLPNDLSLYQSCLNLYEKFEHKKHFVQVGIGGSSLGPEMLISALKKSNRTFSFINNIDPDKIFDQLNNLNLEETLFYFVSKSGGTAETMASLSIITKLLEENGISKENFNQYFIFATDPVKSQLLEIGKELKIETLSVPSNIGGRFSILTPVGLLPSLFAGLDVNALLDGAKKMGENILKEEVQENSLFKMASFLKYYFDQGMDQTVMMPYSSKLRDFSFWFVQLWAESLGKKFSTDGKVINTGYTPIPAYGATDQHSQVQLFMEGPNNKCLIMIEVDKFNHDYSLENNYKTSGLKKLKNYSLQELIKAEFNGTLKALEENQRPFIKLTISSNDEKNMGGLILFFESLTALMGDYLEIDPFDQPGVEQGKIFAFEWLSKLSN